MSKSWLRSTLTKTINFNSRVTELAHSFSNLAINYKTFIYNFLSPANVKTIYEVFYQHCNTELTFKGGGGGWNSSHLTISSITTALMMTIKMHCVCRFHLSCCSYVRDHEAFPGGFPIRSHQLMT